MVVHAAWLCALQHHWSGEYDKEARLRTGATTQELFRMVNSEFAIA